MSHVKCIPLFIDGAYVIELNQYPDKRGHFQELFNVDRYPKYIPITSVNQISCSMSNANVMRGLHCSQYYKLVTCVSGEVLDYIVDIREESPTYLKWVRVRLSESNHRQVFVPKGCAHSFLSTKANSLMVYQQGGTFKPGSEKTISWKDPVLNVQWPEMKDIIISEKDENAENLDIAPGKNVLVKRKRILVIGSSGKVGKAITEYIENQCDDMICFGTHFQHPVGGNTMQFDLEMAGRHLSYAQEILNICCPDTVIVCGAMSRSDHCELDKEKTFLINVQGPVNIAKSANELGIKVVVISTDYVFDGSKDPKLGKYTEEDETNPLAEYGKSKIRMEEELKVVSKGNCLIVRTTTVNGPTHDQSGGFYSLYNKLKDGDEFHVSDVIRSPTYSKDLAAMIIKLERNDSKGIVNASGEEEFRLPEYFRRVAKAMSLNPDLVKEKSRAVYQPQYSALSTNKRRYLLPDFTCHSLEDSVRDWMKTRAEER